MSAFDKYTSMISKLVIGGEEMWNIRELEKCLETDEAPPGIEECIMVPYYINESGRYELYQYELYVTRAKGETFQDYILRKTGKSNMKEIPDDILRIRQLCFVNTDEEDQSNVLAKIRKYLIFLMSDEKIQKEVLDIFSEFDSYKMFLCIY